MNKAKYPIFLLAVVLLASCGQGRSEESRGRDYGRFISEGMPAKEFVLRSLENKLLSIHDFKGKAIILAFWKKSCEECIGILDSLETVYQRYKDRNIAIIAINGDNLDYVPSSRIRDFIKLKGYSFPVYFDHQFISTENYDVIRLPATFLIDREGIVSYVKYGGCDWTREENIQRVEKLL